jgi:hypothetical protein
VSRLEQGELDGRDGRLGDAVTSGLADGRNSQGHEPAEGVAEQEDGVPAGGGSLHGLGPFVGSGGGGVLCPCRQAAGTAPGEARRQFPQQDKGRTPTCAGSTYLDQA